ncbi:LpxI family protein (plasmid) [Pseudorhodobacter turbinis]|uniref:LpxI family protein n=1 Tax=Pseudorhodobacter turbinis TaxID=2500533 RepID=A0A4V1E150_9RHOB|nr:UDP-2,3-diacylglucosamine diphosphatase LpxI [Pseudorhodobacter turbinis]QCO56904.1 LpxI family protein [Pseudorhodobacter turbinis]
MSRTAIIAGRGALPARICAGLAEKPLIAALDGFAPDGVAPDLTFRVERLVPFLNHLLDQGVGRVCFAGAVQRPDLDPSRFDPLTAQMVPRLIAAMQGGDDSTLREVLKIFEEFELEIVSSSDLLPDLTAKAGLLAGEITLQDEADATRAATIVAALGAVDVGQGAVVQAGLCLAVEVLTGTDAMLETVAQVPPHLRPKTSKGLYLKAVKPGQDRRIDQPTIGPHTLEMAAKAGLGGVVFEAGGVLLLDQPALIAQANALGLFLWAREGSPAEQP